MSRNYELDSLDSKMRDVFQRKQAAYELYAETRNRCSEAYGLMQAAWKERRSTKEELNREYQEMQSVRENNREVWDEYSRIRDENNREIERLRAESDSEHQEMINCFERANSCYECGDKSEAPYWSSQGHEHKDRRNSINEEVSRLCLEIKSAKQDANWRAPKVDPSDFHRAKDAFEQAKVRYESAKAEFMRLKAKRDRLKADFDSLHSEHTHLREKFQRKLEEVKATNRRERKRILDKAGVRWSERSDAKIVKKTDGTTQIYHGGIGKGDGSGHGHTALDQFGNKTYDRDAFAEHGSQNFTDNGKGVTIYDRRARPGHEVKGVEGRSNLHGQSYNPKKHPEEVGHITQFYEDGVRVSRSTEDNVCEVKVHWTDTRLPKWHPDYHEKPKD